MEGSMMREHSVLLHEECGEKQGQSQVTIDVLPDGALLLKYLIFIWLQNAAISHLRHGVRLFTSAEGGNMSYLDHLVV